jgi:hypothetical protein
MVEFFFEREKIKYALLKSTDTILPFALMEAIAPIYGHAADRQQENLHGSIGVLCVDSRSASFD